MRSQLPGVYTTHKKDNSIYYRASLTFRNKHISLASFDREEDAHRCYLEGNEILRTPSITLSDYNAHSLLPFDKWVVLLNFRDNGLYFSTPIYLKNKYFQYHLSPECCLKFDTDDLFFYASHKIMVRGGHLFVAEYGMQTNIASRYGIKNHAVYGRDYVFYNHDIYDYRSRNIHIINRYQGVHHLNTKGRQLYRAKIHIIGDYVIGTYKTEIEAAIAYNRAIDVLKKNGVDINYTYNEIDNLSPKTYAEIYSALKINPKITLWNNQ